MTKTSRATLAAIKREAAKHGRFSRKKVTSNEFDAKLIRGLSHQTMTRQRGFKGSKFGAASDGKTLSADERAAIEARMREAGTL
jgi:hypothetical protein